MIFGLPYGMQQKSAASLYAHAAILLNASLNQQKSDGTKIGEIVTNEVKSKRPYRILKIPLTYKADIAKDFAPSVSETIKTALFQTNKGEYKRYLQNSGKWGLHK